MATVATKTNIANWFEIPVKDLERAAAFYERVFDVKLSREEMGSTKMAMFPFTADSPGAAGALVMGETYEPSRSGAVVYFSVESIDVALGKINSSGGKTLMIKKNIGEYGFIAQFEDTEGNRMALHSRK